jgi:putative transposase
MVFDPGEYSWSSYRANGLGQANAIVSPHPVYLVLSPDDNARCDLYRDLFRTALDEQPLADLRMALNQDQPVGNSCFYAQIEAMTGQCRELRKRGRPRKTSEKEPIQDMEQQQLPL